MTIGEALAEAAGRLEAARIASPRLTAEVLLAHSLGLDRARLHTRRPQRLPLRDAAGYRDLIDRRAGGEPLQYITGTQEFYGRPFRVDRSVLIPRPETEHVVEAVLELAGRDAGPIVDVGTGSGCIGVTLALEIEGSRVVLTDVSGDALGVARDNARRLGAPVMLACMDGLGAYRGRAGCVVANPPYVGEDEHAGLQREVREHEPRIALVPSEGPVRLYERLIRESEDRLVEGGLLVLEIGFSMEGRIRGLFGAGWRLLPTRNDLAGIPRVIAARRR